MIPSRPLFTEDVSIGDEEPVGLEAARQADRELAHQDELDQQEADLDALLDGRE